VGQHEFAATSRVLRRAGEDFQLIANLLLVGVTRFSRSSGVTVHEAEPSSLPGM
jgi:hypothetical protein